MKHQYEAVSTILIRQYVHVRVWLTVLHVHGNGPIGRGNGDVLSGRKDSAWIEMIQTGRRTVVCLA